MITTATALAACLRPGERVYLPGSAAEVVPLVEALCAEGAPALDLTTSFVPGINPLPLDRFAPGTVVTGMFVPPGIAGMQAHGRFRHVPLSYGVYAARLKQAPWFDSCVIQVAPPDRHGRCSLGPAVEFTPIAAARSHRIVAVINPLLPRIPGAASIALAEAAVVAELDFPIRPYDVGAPSIQAKAIAARIAAFVADGSTVQIGLGKVPDALLREVVDRRRLRLFSGMISDGARLLLEAGALDADFRHTSCVHVGSPDYYDWVADRPEFEVRACDVTHDQGVLAQQQHFVAVNSAVSVDLFGQANLEMVDGRMVSGVGGAPDFARAAAAASDGVSIVALPAESGRGATRIVPRLDGMGSLPRSDIDVIITEHGTADLRHLGVTERAERLIEIAAPAHRAALADAFRDIARKL